MDPHSILDHNPASPAIEASSAIQSATASLSAGIAAANARVPQSVEPGRRLTREDGGRTLAEMAHRDLDAALQLLAERAHYITGASGAAIALRRGEHKDMLCRGSAGSNVPELGALLSMEYGLSGESVRTRQTQRCDDAERDPRVNREGCRQLGIASVVVMPIVSDTQVLGVFELFSGKPRAFDERAISALQRLSEMVETAVKHAVAAQTALVIEESVGADAQQSMDGIAAEATRVGPTVSVAGPEVAGPDLARPASVIDLSPDDFSPKDLPLKDWPSPEPEKMTLENVEQEETKPEPAPKKQLFWSAATQIPAGATGADQAAASIPVPPVLRNLRKCQACGFPVSQGRALCVECEEKQWRGQRLPTQGREPEGRVPAPVAGPHQNSATAPIDHAARAVRPSAGVPSSVDSTPFLSSAASSESWVAANKYILVALLVAAIVVGAIVWLR